MPAWQAGTTWYSAKGNKYSLTNEKWNELSQSERREIKNKIQTEIQELYLRKPKKFRLKKEVKSKLEKPEEVTEENIDVAA